MTNKTNGLANNYIYQFLYHIIILFIPLILAPYLTRTLGDTSLGVYSFVNSIAYYFVVIANLGILRHGQRIIAKHSNDQDSLRKAFWSLYFLHFIISLFSLIIYFLFVFLFVKNDANIYLIEGIYVASAIFDITWLFYGLENFKSVVIKNLIIRVLEFVCILVFVKKQSDLFVYTIISATAIFIGQIVMFPQAIKQIPFCKFNRSDLKQHIKPLLVFAIAVVATSLYTVLDKTLLGIMTTKENVAYYEYANKIISLPRTFIIIIGTVIFPKACKMVKNGQLEEQKLYFKLSLFTVFFIGFASLFGVLAIGQQFATIYYGEAFSETGKIMMAMCAFPLIIGVGDIIRSQFLIPNEHDKEYIFSIIMNAIVNIVLSLIFIPRFKIYGAVIGTFGAELFGCIFQTIVCKKYINPLVIVTSMLPFAFIGAAMFSVIYIESMFFNQGIISLLIKFFTGAMVFLSLSFLYIFVFEKQIWGLFISKVKSLFKKRNKDLTQ